MPITLKKIAQLVKRKIIFAKPKESNLIVFDCLSDKWLKELLVGVDYFLLSTRFENIKYIYINTDILLFLILNIFKRSLKRNYLFALIKQINPKLVITMIDNSYDFSIAVKYFKDKIPFYAIQNSSRDDIKAEETESKKIYLKTFFCFGEYEKKLYQTNFINVENFIFSGPLKPSLTLNYIKNKKIKIIENEYDICLPAELSIDFSTPKFSSLHSFTNYSDSCLTLAEYVHKLCSKHKLKLIFSSKYFPSKYTDDKSSNTRSYEKEVNFYKKKLKDYKFYIPPRQNKYTGYINALKSNLTIGLSTTLLREAFYLKKKVFACNLTYHPYADFPIKNIASPIINNFNDFEIHALKLLEMKTSKYFEILTDEVDKVVKWNVKSDEIILNSILKQINN